MKKMRKAAVVLLAFLLPALLSGCWDYREVENLTLVDGIAIDRGENGKKYHLTFECIRMSGDQQASGINPWLVETDGDTIFEAVRGALKVSEKRLYFNPCRLVVLSEDIAREGIRPVLDWFLRDAEPRLTLEFAVSREKTAVEILKQEPQPGQLNSYLISNLISGALSYSGDVAKTRLYEIDNILNTAGDSLVLPGVEASEKIGDAKLKLSGTAVFKKDKLIGWLGDKQTRDLNFILDQINEGLIITSEGGQDDNLSLEILGSNTKLEPVVQNGSVVMKVTVHVTAALGERESDKEVPGSEIIQKAEDHAEKTLKKGITDLISQTQREYNSDIFGFGDKIYRSEPKEWEKLGPRWEKAFPKLRCETEVQVKITNTALLHAQKGGG